MKVVLVGNITQSLVNFRGPLLRAMIARGHEVIAVSPEADPRYEADLRDMGVTHRRVPLERTGFNPVADLRYMFGLKRLLREEGADLFLGYTIKPVIYGNLAARLARVPKRAALITGLGYAFGSDSLKQRAVGRVIHVLYRLSLTGADVVFFQNPDDQGEFLKRRYVSQERAALVAGSGVDLGRFERGGAPDEPPIFLLIARLIREKGITQFVDAARNLKRRHPEARFQLLGPLDSNPTAISGDEIAEWQRSGIVEYLGETDDVRPYLQAASVFVLPSYYREGTPRTALEALATGRPVVTTDAPGCRETVVEGVNGFLVEPRDVTSLEQAMERFLVAPELIATMGAASRQLAEGKYDVNLVNAAMLDRLGL